MSLFHINYFSQALQKQSGMYLVLPDGITEPYRVVYLLHGLSDDYTIWLRRTSIERYADQFGLAIVMPDGGRWFYCDTRDGVVRGEAHLLETVQYIDRTFHTLARAEGRAIGGLSMGGYGAMKLGLKYPELFRSVASHSGALDIARQREGVKFPEFDALYGDAPDPGDDCFALAARPGSKPAIYFDCGVDDFLLQHNRDFRAHLQALGIAHSYHEHPGAHTWEYWDKHIVAALRFHRRQLDMKSARG